MPALNETNVRHLLRRTEFVDRSSRVTELLAMELLAMGSMAAAVDDVLDVAANPGSVTFRRSGEWRRQQEMAVWWLDRMAHDARRPFQERLALWWHSHFATGFEKVNHGASMREQLDLFRRECLGNFRELTVTMSVQVAMLRYLDNNQNRASSPNQNFARELMELFVLGVGNYTEADVEAATAAWTGHTDQWNDTTSPYRWRGEWHDGSPKQLLGVAINRGADGRDHGPETVRVMLGAGRVPAQASVAANRGRPTKQVAAEFLSRKLWLHFGSGDPSDAVVGRLAQVLVANDFEVRPWVRAMLLDDEFYTSSTRNGLVRNPIELVVAYLVATGLRADDAPLWLFDAMGQEPFFPPNVAGWKTNGYWVNPSAMEARARVAQQMYWRIVDDYWGPGDTGALRLAGGTIERRKVVDRTKGGGRVWSDAAFLDRVLQLADLRLSSTTRDAILDYARGRDVWGRVRLVQMVLMAPEMHMA
jgi:uncharacterized protein (DUF1800 family)